MRPDITTSASIKLLIENLNLSNDLIEHQHHPEIVEKTT